MPFRIDLVVHNWNAVTLISYLSDHKFQVQVVSSDDFAATGRHNSFLE
jgi:hypothetical protein